MKELTKDLLPIGKFSNEAWYQNYLTSEIIDAECLNKFLQNNLTNANDENITEDLTNLSNIIIKEFIQNIKEDLDIILQYIQNKQVHANSKIINTIYKNLKEAKSTTKLTPTQLKRRFLLILINGIISSHYNDINTNQNKKLDTKLEIDKILANKKNLNNLAGEQFHSSSSASFQRIINIIEKHGYKFKQSFLENKILQLMSNDILGLNLEKTQIKIQVTNEIVKKIQSSDIQEKKQFIQEMLGHLDLNTENIAKVLATHSKDTLSQDELAEKANSLFELLSDTFLKIFIEYLAAVQECTDDNSKLASIFHDSLTKDHIFYVGSFVKRRYNSDNTSILVRKQSMISSLKDKSNIINNFKIRAFCNIMKVNNFNSSKMILSPRLLDPCNAHHFKSSDKDEGLATCGPPQRDPRFEFPFHLNKEVQIALEDFKTQTRDLLNLNSKLFTERRDRDASFFSDTVRELMWNDRSGIGLIDELAKTTRESPNTNLNSDIAAENQVNIQNQK